MGKYIDADTIHWHDDGWACIRKDEYPTIDIEAVSVVHGEWIDKHENGHGFWVGVCSQCGEEKLVDNYCPNCGAKMDGERKESER